MTIQKIVLSTVALGVITLSPTVAFAQTVTPTKQAEHLAKVIAKADDAISDRLGALNKSQTRINGLVRLSAGQKTQFSSEITTDVNALTSLKAKIDADTDVSTAVTDYKTIFTSYRIYAEFLPQLHLLAASDTMDVTADKLSALATKLQARIQAAGNPSSMTSLLSDMQAKIADAKSQYSSVQSEVSPLTPQSYDADPTGTKATLKNARSQIQTGAADLKAAWEDAKQIRELLTSSKKPTPTP